MPPGYVLGRRRGAGAILRTVAEPEETREALRAAVPDQTAPPPARRRLPQRWSQAVLAQARRGAARGGRALWRWARGPAGRVVVPGLAIIAVLTASGASGRWLIPRTAPHPTVSAATRLPQPVQPSGPAPVVGPTPINPLSSATPSPATAGTRLVDGLAGWAGRMSPGVGVSPVALAAYGYAQLTVAQTTPLCHLSWTTLAGIGRVESDHGTANGAVLQPDGKALPPIIGDALDGQGGRKLIRDTDGGLLDGDRTYDHAVGPMQFLPSTWQQYRADADSDGVADPNDINDAALAAANYLCSGGRDLATPGGWWSAVLSYNAIQAYAQSVFNAADDYGQRSRTVT
jgi:Transglycosylase SLT domain